MPDNKQIREELLQGAKKALENYPKPEQRLVSVRAVDLLAALGPSTETGRSASTEKSQER